MNDHQKCTVMTYKERYEKTKQELISVQASVVSSSAQEEEGDNTKETTVHLEDELRMVVVIFMCLVAVEFNFKRQILEIRKTFHLILFYSISFRFVSFHFNSMEYCLYCSSSHFPQVNPYFTLQLFKQKELCQQVQVQLNNSTEEIQVSNNPI